MAEVVAEVLQKCLDIAHGAGALCSLGYPLFMKRLKFFAAIAVVLAGSTSAVKAHLVDAGGLFSPPGSQLLDPAVRAAALESQFHTGPLTFLGRYVHDRTGAVTFVPGAISDPSKLSFTHTEFLTGLLSWDLAGTGFQNKWGVTLFSGDDYAFNEAYRVTRDEFLNSLGPQLMFGTPIDIFGTASGVPEAGSTALLLGITGVGFGLLRRFRAH
ncbi:MAG: hypothetical protein H0T95_00165 [Chthoniobacterales bacterium]|nr:hypothetical protein [Chthoniobacterales bacterium]